MVFFFNLLIAIIIFPILTPIMIAIGIAVRLTSKGPALHWSKRIGINNQIFLMPKFRTMSISTPQVATHLLENSKSYLTPIGDFLRKTSLDEIPQILSIIKRDMNFVGPRPALFNQNDLIQLRTSKSLHLLAPGITGWAQINGRDDIPIPKKVELEEYYLHNRSLRLDCKIIALTAYKVLKKENISH